MIKKTRGIVMGRKGIVASAHPLISSTGVHILKQGGNAMDAAIAMANVCGVVLPDMCGLGGDCFLLHYDAKTRQVTAINGSGPAPEKATIAYFKEHGYKKIPKDGMLSVSVPGAVDTYFKALECFGTMSYGELIEDAYNLAKDGVCVSEKVARHMHTDYDKLLKYEGVRNLYLDAQDKPYHYGDVIKNEAYANSLKILAQKGPKAFYQGEITDKIIAHSNKHGGLLSHEDFKDYHCEVLAPIKAAYRDYMVYQTPPVSQGIIHLEELHILNQFDLKAMGFGSAQAIHTMVEAKKLAFIDRNKYFGDPSFNANPIERILSSEYAQIQAAKIKPTACIDTSSDVIGYDPHGHTTSLVVVDAQGNAVSLIHSVSATWGSGEVVEDTGILLNNRIGTGFNLKEGHPNCLEPGKKTMHTLNTYLITNQDGSLKYVGNTPGGDNQPQWNMQVVCNLIDFDLDVQSAVEACKWADSQSTNPYGEQMENILKIENELSDDVFDELRSYGHTLHIIEPYTCSGASQIIEVKGNQVVYAGSDPRADGCAIAES